MNDPKNKRPTKINDPKKVFDPKNCWTPKQFDPTKLITQNNEWPHKCFGPPKSHISKTFKMLTERHIDKHTQFYI